MQKHNLLIVTPTHALGCATSTIEIFASHLNGKLFNVHLRYLTETDYPSIYQLLIAENINIVLTNSIFFGVDQQYRKALDLLRFCKAHHIPVVDLAHFAKFDVVVDSLLSKRLFVSQTLLLKYSLFAVKHGLTLEKYDYLYNPIPVIARSDDDKRKRGEVTTKQPKFVIGRIGRANTDKWDNLMIELAPPVLKNIPNCKFLIQSIPTELMSKIPQSIRQSFVILPESMDHQQVLQTIASCDVLVQTSKIGESFGCAIAEGMALGKPIITNSTDFLAPVYFDRDNAQTELVEDKINGFFENNPVTMAEKIIELYTDRTLYNKIAQANYTKATKLFDINLLTKRLENFLLGKNPNLVVLPLNLADYQTRVKSESLLSILKLNTQYILRRLKRKINYLGLLGCC